MKSLPGIKIALFGLLLYGVSQYAFKTAKPVADEERHQQSASTPAGPDPINVFLTKVDELGIPDQNLVKCIKKSAEYFYTIILAGTITSPTEMTRIECIKDGISNISGLEKFTRLKKLDLSRNPVSHLGPIEQLHSLEELDLAQTQVTSLWSISGLPIKKLDIGGLKLNDLRELHGFKQLKDLTFSIGDDYPCAEVDAFFETRPHFYIQRPSQCIDQSGEKVRY